MSTINIASSPLSIAPATASDQLLAGTQGTGIDTRPASLRNPTSFGAASDSDTTGGGLVSDLASAARSVVAKGGSAIEALVGMASTGMKGVEEGLMKAQEGGQGMDPAALALANRQMANYEIMMQQAAKLQKKQEEAAAIWTR